MLYLLLFLFQFTFEILVEAKTPTLSLCFPSPASLFSIQCSCPYFIPPPHSVFRQVPFSSDCKSNSIQLGCSDKQLAASASRRVIRKEKRIIPSKYQSSFGVGNTEADIEVACRTKETSTRAENKTTKRTGSHLLLGTMHLLHLRTSTNETQA